MLSEEKSRVLITGRQNRKTRAVVRTGMQFIRVFIGLPFCYFITITLMILSESFLLLTSVHNL